MGGGSGWLVVTLAVRDNAIVWLVNDIPSGLGVITTAGSVLTTEGFADESVEAAEGGGWVGFQGRCGVCGGIVVVCRRDGG